MTSLGVKKTSDTVAVTQKKGYQLLGDTMTVMIQRGSLSRHLIARDSLISSLDCWIFKNLTFASVSTVD